MNWLNRLYQTYENCIDRLGDENDPIPLAPYCHSDRTAHVEVIIDSEGNFLGARQVSLESTIIPISEKSVGRTGKDPASHPLCDKLQYVAGDYKEFGGDKPSRFDGYLNTLQKWSESSYTHQKIQAVYAYVKKRCLIRDLITHGVLYADETGKLMKTWTGDKKQRPVFFSYFKTPNWQGESLVRWIVKIPEVDESRLWLDREIWQLWQAYYKTTLSTQSLCYITGAMEYNTYSHAKRLRGNMDNAKLISANDDKGYTFRGRFTDDTGLQACGIGFDVSQKAHNTLRWLIARQGWQNEDLAFVAWAVSGADIPKLMADTSALFKGKKIETPLRKSDSAKDIGEKLSKLLAGYTVNLKPRDNVVVMGLNSATPGRMAIIYYRELAGSDFLARIQAWHQYCTWFQRFSEKKRFIGAPAPKDIAKAAFGKETKDKQGNKQYEIEDKLCNATVERLIPCMIDGLQIPYDLVEATKRRACKGHSLEKEEWEKTLGIACSLYKYHAFHKQEKEDFTMALDRKRNKRDYLYGRLLAVADCLESFALDTMKVEKDRPTNARRLMQRFADHPCNTWLTIEPDLETYRKKLGKRVKKYDDALDEIMRLFDTEEFIRPDKPLSGEFLLGFHTQRAELQKKTTYFKVTETTLERLKHAKVTEQIVAQLQTLQGKKEMPMKKFWKMIKQLIGDEQAALYKKPILKHAKFDKPTPNTQN